LSEGRFNLIKAKALDEQRSKAGIGGWMVRRCGDQIAEESFCFGQAPASPNSTKSGDARSSTFAGSS
jgi:hypothetical protein